MNYFDRIGLSGQSRDLIEIGHVTHVICGKDLLICSNHSRSCSRHGFAFHALFHSLKKSRRRISTTRRKTANLTEIDSIPRYIPKTGSNQLSIYLWKYRFWTSYQNDNLHTAEGDWTHFGSLLSIISLAISALSVNRPLVGSESHFSMRSKFWACFRLKSISHRKFEIFST